MSTVDCPVCGHGHPAERLHPGVLNFCARCEQPFTPPEANFARSPGVTSPASDPFARPSIVPPASACAPSASFAGLVKTEPAFNRPVGPQLDEPNASSAFLGIFVVIGLLVVFCGGIGGFIAIRTREKVTIAARQAEDQQRERHEARLNEIGAQIRQQKPLAPPTEIKPVAPRKVDRRPPESSIPAIPPPDFESPLLPTADKSNSDSKQRTSSSRPASVPKAFVPKNVDDVLAALNDPNTTRPKWSALRDLERLPVEAERRHEVSVASSRSCTRPIRPRHMRPPKQRKFGEPIGTRIR